MTCTDKHLRLHATCCQSCVQSQHGRLKLVHLQKLLGLPAQKVAIQSRLLASYQILRLQIEYQVLDHLVEGCSPSL